MDKIPVLIAIGHNNIQAACRFFTSSLEEAKERCEELLETEGSVEGDAIYFRSDKWEEKLPNGLSESYKLIHKDMLEAFSKENIEVEVLDVVLVDGKATYEYEYNIEPDNRVIRGSKTFYKNGFGSKLGDYPDEDILLISYQKPIFKTRYDDIVKKLFTHYYGGCGEVYSYKLVEIEPDTIFTCWDLD